VLRHAPDRRRRNRYRSPGDDPDKFEIHPRRNFIHVAAAGGGDRNRGAVEGVRSQESGVRMTAPRAPAKTFRDLVVWQKAHQFVLGAYIYSGAFPRSETYGLVSQLRRAAVSIPANIAEGFRRKGNPDKVRMLNIAQGSIEECRYYLILAEDLNY